MATAYAPPPTNPPPAAVGDPFAHIRHFPMFPLLSPEDMAAVAKMRQDAAKLASYIQPTPQLSVAEKAVMHASGMEIMNVRKMENAAYKTTASLTAANAEAVHTAMLTRWAAFVDGKMVVVDLYEIRPMASWMGNPWRELLCVPLYCLPLPENPENEKKKKKKIIVCSVGKSFEIGREECRWGQS